MIQKYITKRRGNFVCAYIDFFTAFGFDNRKKAILRTYTERSSREDDEHFTKYIPQCINLF